MKRLTPTPPHVQREIKITDDANTTALGLDDTNDVSHMSEQMTDALPKSKVYSSLKKLSSFKKLKKDFKMQNQKKVFVDDVKSLLSHLNKNEHRMDTELLIEVLNATEEYFIYGDFQSRETSKKSAIKELMLDFFDTEEILERFVHVLDSKVKKSTFVRRLLKRLKNFFF